MTSELEVMDIDILPVQKIKAQVDAVRQLMNEVMVEVTERNPNGHYGKIPGCGDKPALLKAGAEKLALCFKLDLQTETEIVELGGGHREYRCITTVYSKGTGDRLGNGAGCATTMETKWRYRSEATGEEVPAKYWETRLSSLIGGSEFTTRKVYVGGKQKWMIFHLVEHPNPADYYNTCQKMAEKRSKVCAVLNVTAASDIFTQDEEERDNEPTEEGKKPPVRKTAGKKKAEKAEKPAGVEVKTTIGKVTTKIGKFPHKILGEGGVLYSTYSDTIAKEADKVVEAGAMARIVHKGDQYNTIVKLDIIEPNE